MPKRHNGKHCPLAVRQRIVNALANGDSKRAIARGLRTSNNNVAAIAEQEWQQVDARKQRIVAQCEATPPWRLISSLNASKQKSYRQTNWCLSLASVWTRCLR